MTSRKATPTKTSGKAAKSSIEASFQIILAQGGPMVFSMRFTNADLQDYVKGDEERQKYFKLYGQGALVEFAKELYSDAAATVEMAFLKNEKSITWCHESHRYITSIKIGEQEYFNAASTANDSGVYLTMNTSNILFCIQQGSAYFNNL